MDERDAVLEFWFPEGFGADLETHREQWTWRMRGGADVAIVERFSELCEQACRGKLDSWAETARGRLALVLVLDQFSRSVWRDTPRAFAQDPKALALVLEGLANGHYGALRTPWEKTFFVMPLVHCEGPDHLERADRAVALARVLLAEVPEHLKPLYEFSAQQPVEHRKVIAAFGRHPHRNRILGRESTPEELGYLERGIFPHQRDIPRVEPSLPGVEPDRPRETPPPRRKEEPR
jgi:uncharacterized protein (DUF924 family)